MWHAKKHLNQIVDNGVRRVRVDINRRCDFAFFYVGKCDGGGKVGAVGFDVIYWAD